MYVVVEPNESQRIGSHKRSYPKYLTSLKPTKRQRQRQPFIVADTETVIIDQVHVPYVVGFLVVRHLLSEERGYNMIETYFFEDYHTRVFKTFRDRSNRMLSDFIEPLVVVVRQNPLIQTVYFHNFSRFDGIMLLRHLVINVKKYKIKPLIQDNVSTR